MNIIGLSTQTSGCGYHRVLLPLGFMDGIKGYVTNMVTEDKMDGWDILIYNRISLYDKDWSLTKELMNCRVVMDIDDYWRLPPNHLNYYTYEEIAERIENNIRMADMVTVTNEALASKVRPFNDNVVVIPNALPYGRNQFTEHREPSDRIRIFWCGGVTHEHDLELLRNPLKKLQMYRDKIQMVIGGVNEENDISKEIWGKMVSAFTGQLPYKKIHGTLPTQYMQMYEHADIMLIPLEESEWHACKSNLKILEAAAKKIPVIVSNVAPYNQDQDAPVLWVNSQKDWFNHLNYLINNEQVRVQMGEDLHQWAKSKYNLTDVNKRRFKAFSSLCKAPALL